MKMALSKINKTIEVNDDLGLVYFGGGYNINSICRGQIVFRNDGCDY